MTEESKKIVMRMARSGCSDQQIAEVIHYEPRSVAKARIDQGIRKQRGRKKIPQRRADRIIRLYLQGITFDLIAEAAHVSVSTVVNYTRRWREENEKRRCLLQNS